MTSVTTTAFGPLPQIECGQAKFTASRHDVQGDFFAFDDIPYAAPPTGERRFLAPAACVPPKSRTYNGSEGAIPPQAVPVWARGTGPWNDPGMEDCLYLDIKVPRSVLEARRSGKTAAAVVVWIYGGGYTAGSKRIFGSGAGLMARSPEPLIYVALNYRLGIFGFLAGPHYMHDGGVPNLGLLDQRFALEWINDNIAAFGGDVSRITVMGQSAGAGSIYHQITAYGGQRGKAPFARAILQSPGFYPITSEEVMDRHYEATLRHADCESLAELRKLSENRLKAVNLAVIDEAPYGQFLLGPVVDGTFVPDLPGKLLSCGAFDKDITIMLGQCYNEGGDYVEPLPEYPPSYLSEYLDRTFHGIRPALRNHVTDNLYPPPSAPDSSDNNTTQDSSPEYLSRPPYYTTPKARLQRLISDSIYIQHNNAISTAFQEQTYNYLMSLGPGTHGTDLSYTFFNEGQEEQPVLPGLTKVKSPELAHALQKYLTSFVVYGSPNRHGVNTLPEMRMRGDMGIVLEFDDTGLRETKDPSQKDHCAWWQTAQFI